MPDVCMKGIHYRITGALGEAERKMPWFKPDKNNAQLVELSEHIEKFLTEHNPFVVCAYCWAAVIPIANTADILRGNYICPNCNEFICEDGTEWED